MTPRFVALANILTVLVLLFAAPASAQRDWNSYSDKRFEQPSRFGNGDDKAPRNTPGEFDYYALVLSWSPTYCSSPQGDDDTSQCNRHDGRRYAFVLHGLWPQYSSGYPSDCYTRRKPYLPQPLIDSMLDIMPSPGLVIHEYKKHGTCSGLEPASYYALARRLFNSIRIPETFVNPFEVQYVSPRKLEDELISRNPGLRPGMIAISCEGRGGKLREVRICFDREGRPRNCGENENERRMCNAQELFVPPVRSTKPDPESSPVSGYGGSPLPVPR